MGHNEYILIQQSGNLCCIILLQHFEQQISTFCEAQPPTFFPPNLDRRYMFHYDLSYSGGNGHADMIRLK